MSSGCLDRDLHETAPDDENGPWPCRFSTSPSSESSNRAASVPLTMRIWPSTSSCSVTRSRSCAVRWPDRRCDPVGAENLTWRAEQGGRSKKNVGTCRGTYVPYSGAPTVRQGPEGDLEILISNPIGVFGSHTFYPESNCAPQHVRGVCCCPVLATCPSQSEYPAKARPMRAIHVNAPSRLATRNRALPTSRRATSPMGSGPEAARPTWLAPCVVACRAGASRL
jgi:hypothetical protein